MTGAYRVDAPATITAIWAWWPQEWATPPGAPAVGNASMSASIMVAGASAGPSTALTPVMASPESIWAPVKFTVNGKDYDISTQYQGYGYGYGMDHGRW